VLKERDALREKLSSALLVKPSGEPREARYLTVDECLTCDHPGVWRVTKVPMDGVVIKQIDGHIVTRLALSAVVQPVRFESTLGAMEGQNDGK
jgi:hypothetical protein